MGWFLIFAASVFALYFWREYKVQQRDMQSAQAPHRTGERQIGQVMTLTDGDPRWIRKGRARQPQLGAARPGRSRRHPRARHRG